MAFPSWLQILIARLSFLGKPLPLASSLTAVILGIFIWEYATHPEWFGSYTQDETLPNSSVDLSGLTPEEQAAVADIDNLALLLNEFGSPSDGTTNLQTPAGVSEDNQNSLLQDVLALSQPSENPEAASGGGRFDKYLAQYQFLGRSMPADQTSNLPTQDNGFAAFTPTGSSQEADTLRPVSPLEAALQNQTPFGQSANRATNSNSAEDAAAQSTDANSETANGNTAEGSNPGLTGTLNSQTVTIPGVPYPVLPTTPQMSPPPGTTGYTPPSTLELMPPLPGSSSSPFPLSPSSAGVPPLPAGSSSVNLGTPQVDVGNGYVTPYTPVVPAVTPTTIPGATPSPFSVPRPPGSYIGGGYINTFSNPSGPSN